VATNPYYVEPQGGYSIGQGLYGLSQSRREREEEEERLRREELADKSAEEAYGKSFNASPRFVPEQQPQQQGGIGGMGGMEGIGGLSSLWSGGGSGAAAGGGAGATAGSSGGTAAGVGGGAAAGGSAAGGSASGGSALSSAGPWGILAAIIIGNEYNAKKGGYRAESSGEHFRDVVSAEIVEQDFQDRWLPKWFGEETGKNTGVYENDVTGFGSDTAALTDIMNLDFSNAWDTLKEGGSAARVLKKIF
jgi:hypothetical protein